MDKMQCRMCAKYQKNEEFVPLSDELRNLIDYFCRIQLLLNENLPNSLCNECNHKIVDFSRYSERAKGIQMKMMIEHEIHQNVKVEIEELPSLYYDKHSSLFIEEPKVELMTRSESGDDDLASTESDWKNESSSDSEFLADIKKRVKSESTGKRRRGRPKKIREVDEDFTLDMAEEEFEGRKWSDMKLKCTECDHESLGPFELRCHYFLFHTLDLPYNCVECPETLTYFYQLLNHCIGHRKSLNFCCVICSQMFKNMKTLNQHYTTDHKNDDQAIKHCGRCGQFFRKPIDLSNHEINVHQVKSSRESKDTKVALYTVEYLFEEELVDDNFKQNKEFDVPGCDKNVDGSLTEDCKNRFASEMWSEVMHYDCSDCKITIKSPYLLYVHYNSKHPDQKTNFTCKLCSEDKTFLNFEAFVNHTFIIHHEHLRYFCFICCSGFWDHKSLYRHYKTMHEEYNVFLCLYCGKHHKVGYELKHHMKIHSKTKTKGEKSEKKEKSPGIFNCNHCPKSFPKKAHLQRHLESHKKNENKIWICETCGKNFNAKSTLINHAMVHMNDKPFVCNICGEGFKNKYKLTYHKGIHTGEKNFGCEVCGQRFRAKGTLKNHMLAHSGERPWGKLLMCLNCINLFIYFLFKGCEFCDKKFSAKYDLSVHTRLHTGEYTHECQICHERYPSWSNYSKHMRGRHQIDPRSDKKKKYDALHKRLQEQKVTEEGQDEVQQQQQSSQQQYF